MCILLPLYMGCNLASSLVFSFLRYKKRRKNYGRNEHEEVYDLISFSFIFVSLSADMVDCQPEPEWFSWSD